MRLNHNQSPPAHVTPHYSLLAWGVGLALGSFGPQAGEATMTAAQCSQAPRPDDKAAQILTRRLRAVESVPFDANRAVQCNGLETTTPLVAIVNGDEQYFRIIVNSRTENMRAVRINHPDRVVKAEPGENPDVRSLTRRGVVKVSAITGTPGAKIKLSDSTRRIASVGHTAAIDNQSSR